MTRLAAIVLALAACGTRDPPAQTSAPDAAPSALVTFNLSDATVEQAARTLAELTHRPAVIAADAHALASCARLSVIAPEPMPATTAPRLLAAALARSGLELVDGREGWEVRRGSGAPPPECAVPQPAPAVGSPFPHVPPPPSAPTAPDARDEQIRAGIRIRSETEVELTPTAWDLLGDSWGDMSAVSQARIIPHEVGGVVVGMKLYGIRSTSVFAALGLQNGDTVMALDGHVLTSPDEALQAYAGARGHDHVTVTVDRRGGRLEIHYRRAAR